MLRFFKRYLTFFAAGVLFCQPSVSGLSAADGDFYVLNYEDAAVSPRGRVISMAEKLKRLSRQSLPAKQERSVREIFVRLSDGKKEKPFSCRTDRRGNLRIILPDSYGKLLTEPGSLPRLAGMMLFGRLGKNPELERHFRNSWFTVGLARKAIGEMTPVRTPFADYFPAAYTLTSARRYPELDALLAEPLTPDDTTLRLLYEEYCELLVLICARNGLFKAGMLVRMLDELEKKPERNDMPELFRKFSLPVLKKRHPKLFPDGVAEAGVKKAYEEWFRKELDAMLNWNFLPASAEKIEAAYLETVHFEGKLKTEEEGEKEKPESVYGGLAELIRCRGRLENADLIEGKMIAGLSRLIKQSPPDLKIPVSDVRNALQAFSADPSQSAGERLLRAEQNFWRALERNLALEKFLSDAETECTAPAARYYLTFRLIDYRNRTAFRPLKTLAELLEQTGKEMVRQ